MNFANNRLPKLRIEILLKKVRRLKCDPWTHGAKKNKKNKKKNSTLLLTGFFRGKPVIIKLGNGNVARDQFIRNNQKLAPTGLQPFAARSGFKGIRYSIYNKIQTNKKIDFWTRKFKISQCVTNLNIFQYAYCIILSLQN